MTKYKFRGVTKSGDTITGGINYTVGGEPVIWHNGSAIRVIPDSVAQLVGFDKFGDEVYEGDTVEDIVENRYIADFNGVWQGDNFLSIGVSQFKLVKE